MTQADRDAAADCVVATTGNSFGVQIMRDGVEDEHPLIQALARHRIAERDRCVAIAADLATKFSRCCAHAEKHLGYQMAAIEIAQAMGGQGGYDSQEKPVLRRKDGVPETYVHRVYEQWPRLDGAREMGGEG